MSLEAGLWRGTSSTWMGPGDPVVAAFEGTAESVFDGKFWRLRYSSVCGDSPHTGELTVGFEKGEKRWTAIWFDTFHCGHQVMHLIGVPGDVPDMAGAYPYEDQHIGWRIRVEAHEVRMWHDYPPGEQSLAVVWTRG